MVESNHNGGLAAWQMNSNEAKQTLEMQHLVAEFPLVDQLALVDIYYNQADQDIAASRQILS